LSEIRQIDANIPIGLLVYFNMVVARGIDQFFKQAKEAGVDGILMADLPAENAEEIISPARAHGIAPIFLVSPLTSEARLETILQVAGGFIYFVSRLGVTGVQSRAADADAHLSEKFATIKQKSDLPVCAGFGIAEPSDARLMFQMGADGVIAGSKVIQLAESGLTSLNFSALAHYYKEMLAVADYHKSTQTAFDKS
jgi:tryptophan synthase alpha chain